LTYLKLIMLTTTVDTVDVSNSSVSTLTVVREILDHFKELLAL